MARLDDRVVLVTGGGSGIGRSTVLTAVDRGAHVTAVDRDPHGLAGTAAAADAIAPGRCLAVAADVGDEDVMAEVVAETIGAAHRLDGVVTSAGIFHGPDLALAEHVPLDAFLEVLRVNLVGTFLAIKHALPHLARDESEPTTSIVTIASTAALRGHGQGAAYTASKGGVAAMTRLLAVQYGSRGVRVNCICPGGVDTPMTGGIWQTEEGIARIKRTHPLGKVAQPEDIADVAAFLLSDDARHVTGQILAVDGGVSST